MSPLSCELSSIAIMNRRKHRLGAVGSEKRRVQIVALVVAAALVVLTLLVLTGAARQIVILVRDAVGALGLLG